MASKNIGHFIRMSYVKGIRSYKINILTATNAMKVSEVTRTLLGSPHRPTVLISEANSVEKV